MSHRFSISFILLFLSLSAQGAGVLVYFPTTHPVLKMSKSIGALTKEEVTVFGKYSEFESGIQLLKPNTIISTDAFAMMGTEYKEVDQLKVNGALKGKYILLSLDKSWKNKTLSQARVGTVEFIRRNKIKDYFAKIFGFEFKTIKTVSKVEDLFSLLVFRSVDVIAVRPYIYEELKEKFNTDVFEVGSSTETGLLSVFRRVGGEIEKSYEDMRKYDYSSK